MLQAADTVDEYEAIAEFAIDPQRLGDDDLSAIYHYLKDERREGR